LSNGRLRDASGPLIVVPLRKHICPHFSMQKRGQ
jgi:hypothetical protein